MSEISPPPPTGSRLLAEGLRFTYGQEAFQVRVSRFEVAPGETVALTGPSGAGKTTLLRLLSGLLKPDQGDVEIDGHSLGRLNAEAVRTLRLNRMGLVFQDFALVDYLTVGENVLLPLRLAGAHRPALQQALERGRDLAMRMEIGHYWSRLASELSQGERQRVALVRALAHEPAVVFADEPTAALDERRRDLATALLLDYAATRKAPLILVTHDSDLLPRFDRSVQLADLS